MKIIPAIDIISAKCVRLSKGDYNTIKTYSSSPLDVAKEFEDSGIKYLHLVDLDGAKEKKIINYKTLELIASKTNLHVDFGGGVKSDDDLKIAFESGAKQVNIGSVAISERELFLRWINEFGSDKIILSADSLNGVVKSNGWLEDSDKNIIDFILDYEKNGVKTVVATDISKDGMLQGPSYDLYSEIAEKSKVELIASGGISSIDDVYKLADNNLAGTIIGKAIYEGRISLKELSKLC